MVPVSGSKIIKFSRRNISNFLWTAKNLNKNTLIFMFIYLYDYFTYMGVYVPCVPAENWRDRQLWATMCMLEIKLSNAHSSPWSHLLSPCKNVLSWTPCYPEWTLKRISELQAQAWPNKPYFKFIMLNARCMSHLQLVFVHGKIIAPLWAT